ncbi:MAG TPA: FKBP-type peptidyl-prolyl cis-trans isomerase [Aquabacterium sp.]|uniref:FKBP-type peptidyl-prolyl cis-trans isomerase n=1 Tax=Aquabacterium sp. TaxID=1872578 RepID=UPI002E37E52D|nr:FKBP-type peptidyl-prolyl cis-trans isomerase [Aquabacterium sp.]HEX5355241.1 FKBP-type peptidyl-prolyl cis-trans isomerase [Aquabacterium sp.]
MNAKILVALALSAVALQARAADPKPSTQKLPSGVEVTHLTVGKGAKPTASDTVKVHYEGKLANGKVFDSSYKDGQPISFPLDRVIKCWTEGVQTMQVGGKATLRCPSKTAYGAAGAGGVIPPNADLTFTVELLGIEN